MRYHALVVCGIILSLTGAAYSSGPDPGTRNSPRKVLGATGTGYLLTCEKEFCVWEVSPPNQKPEIIVAQKGEWVQVPADSDIHNWRRDPRSKGGVGEILCKGHVIQLSTGTGWGSCREWNPGILVCADDEANVAISDCRSDSGSSYGAGDVSVKR